MAEAGLHVPASLVRYGAYLHSAARQMATELLSLPDRPTAIVAACDVQAVGCLEAATQLGINVPDELSVVGYDDIDLAGLMGLSTVRQPLIYSGERGADLVLEALVDAQSTTEHRDAGIGTRRAGNHSSSETKGNTMTDTDTAEPSCGGRTRSSTSSTRGRSPTATAIGIGDFEGIRSHLDHLRDLGVDAIWLSPCFPSPQADHGYDVADYFDIEPKYGTLDDFDRMLADAKERGIRIMLDIVPEPLQLRPRLVPGRAEGRAGLARAGPLLVQATARARTATSRPTTGGRSSVVRHGPGSPRPMARPASGTSTRSRHGSPTSTGTTTTSSTTSIGC